MKSCFDRARRVIIFYIISFSSFIALCTSNEINLQCFKFVFGLIFGRCVCAFRFYFFSLLLLFVFRFNEFAAFMDKPKLVTQLHRATRWDTWNLKQKIKMKFDNSQFARMCLISFLSAIQNEVKPILNSISAFCREKLHAHRHTEL